MEKKVGQPRKPDHLKRPTIVTTVSFETDVFLKDEPKAKGQVIDELVTKEQKRRNRANKSQNT